MTPESVLAVGRVAHLALMLDMCLVTRGGEPEWDPETGAYTVPVGTSVYEGRCRMKPLTAEDVQAGEREVALRGYRVALPVDATAPEPGDVLTVTASTDPELSGHPLVVTAVELASARTARWLTVEDRRG